MLETDLFFGIAPGFLQECRLIFWKSLESFGWIPTISGFLPVTCFNYPKFVSTSARSQADAPSNHATAPCAVEGKRQKSLAKLGLWLLFCHILFGLILSLNSYTFLNQRILLGSQQWVIMGYYGFLSCFNVVNHLDISRLWWLFTAIAELKYLRNTLGPEIVGWENKNGVPPKSSHRRWLQPCLGHVWVNFQQALATHILSHYVHRFILYITLYYICSSWKILYAHKFIHINSYFISHFISYVTYVHHVILYVHTWHNYVPPHFLP